MAVTIQVDIDCVFARIGIPHDYLEPLWGSEIDVKITPTKLLFVHESEVLYKVPISSNVVKHFASGTAAKNFTSFQAALDLRNKVVDILGHLFPLPDTPLADPDMEKLSGGKGPQPEEASGGKPSAHSAKTGGDHLDTGQITEVAALDGDRVSLCKAEKLYQPVYGTDSTTRYHLVANMDDVRVAARWKGSSLSVRIEGPKISDHKKRLSDLGFGPLKNNKNSIYTSVHLHVDSAPLASKTIGAIVYGLGLKNRTPIPDMVTIHNKGA